MSFLSGVICGLVLMVLALLIADSLVTATEPWAQLRTIVNWDVAGERLRTSIEIMREELHKLTR